MRVLFLLLLLTTSAIAQQQQQLSPTESALQINSIIGTWAQTLVQQGRVIDDMQKQLTAAQARIKELESKKPDGESK